MFQTTNQCVSVRFRKHEDGSKHRTPKAYTVGGCQKKTNVSVTLLNAFLFLDTSEEVVWA